MNSKTVYCIRYKRGRYRADVVTHIKDILFIRPLGLVLRTDQGDIPLDSIVKIARWEPDTLPVVPSLASSKREN